MIPIKLVGNRALVFDLDDARALRGEGITGVLSGTLPMAAQQNVFLGVPLQLLREEVIWLVTNNKGYLVPSEIFYKSLKAGLGQKEAEKLRELKAEDFERQRREKDEKMSAKYDELGISKRHHEGNNTEMSYFYEIPNTSKDSFSSYQTFQEYYNKPELQRHLLERFKQATSDDPRDELDVAIYNNLKDRDYYIAPGLRFGGKFIAYPGDPLLYHSHLIVNGKNFYDEDIGLSHIANGGRLATAVKKVWAIGGETEEKEVKFFSIEWSGFG